MSKLLIKHLGIDHVYARMTNKVIEAAVVEVRECRPREGSSECVVGLRQVCGQTGGPLAYRLDYESHTGPA